jgi:RNA recognition motif-containing protein
MLKKLFVGSLPWSIKDSDLEDLFSDYGTVQSARVITERDTGRSRGFGFVEIETDDIAAIIQSTDGKEVDGRAIRVNYAVDKPSNGGGGGGGGGGGRNRRDFRSDRGNSDRNSGYGRRGRYWV